MLSRLLAQAGGYTLAMRLIGADRARRNYVEGHIRPRPGDRILDIGCGPADILEFLPPVDYYGFDLSPEYIAAAQNKFAARGHFQVAPVDRKLISQFTGFDLVLALGIVHHLTDAEALDLFAVAHAALKPGGRLVTLDGCYVPGQSPLARRFLRNDRGQYVRDEAGYVSLARSVFSDVIPTVTHRMLRIPYTHLIMECRKEGNQA